MLFVYHREVISMHLCLISLDFAMSDRKYDGSSMRFDNNTRSYYWCMLMIVLTAVHWRLWREIPSSIFCFFPLHACFEESEKNEVTLTSIHVEVVWYRRSQSRQRCGVLRFVAMFTIRRNRECNFFLVTRTNNCLTDKGIQVLIWFLVWSSHYEL
jgi:hypothetical protein